MSPLRLRPFVPSLVPRFAFELLFIALYIALDAVSFIHPMHGLNITPWNPAPALGLVYLLRRGRAGALPLTLAVVLGDLLLRSHVDSVLPNVVATCILASSYVALGSVLSKRLHGEVLLERRETLLAWLVPIAIGTFLISVLYILSLRLLGLFPSADWLSGILRFWVGDAVGITVAMPLMWWLSSDRGRALLRNALLQTESLAWLGLCVAVLAVTFGQGEGGVDNFYFLFLPIVWASTRQGMPGAILSATFLQIGVISCVEWLDFSAITISELQLLALVMALVGFFIGCVVEELRRASEELRHTLRLAAAGEMAGALAHELNQPLTALSAYAAACETLLARKETGSALSTAIQGMLDETARAGEVVRRLRDFFRTGATKLDHVPLRELVSASVASSAERARRENVTLDLGEIPDVTLLADRLQIEVVLRNLLGNAFDALRSTVSDSHRIALRAEILSGMRVSLRIEDSGPGLDAADAIRAFEPFVSTKSSGLGLGLAISRAIIQAHGGSLWCEAGPHGTFRLVLPIHGLARNA